MTKLIALAAFNTAVVSANTVHAVGRAIAGSGKAVKETGASFWAGLSYAHAVNKTNGAKADRLSREDAGIPAKATAAPTPAAVPFDVPTV